MSQRFFCMSVKHVKQPMSANQPMSLGCITSGNGPKMRPLSVNQPTFLNRPLNPRPVDRITSGNSQKTCLLQAFRPVFHTFWLVTTWLHGLRRLPRPSENCKKLQVSQVFRLIWQWTQNEATVNPFKFAGINVRVLGPAAYSQELKFTVQL